MSTIRQQKMQAAWKRILESKPPEEREAFKAESLKAYGAMEAIIKAVIALEDAYSAVDLTVIPDREVVKHHIDLSLDALVGSAKADPELSKMSVLKIVDMMRGAGRLRDQIESSGTGA